MSTFKIYSKFFSNFLNRKNYIFLFFVVIVMSGCESKVETVTVKPQEIEDALQNPERGFTTTGSFNEDIKGKRHPQSG